MGQSGYRLRSGMEPAGHSADGEVLARSEPSPSGLHDHALLGPLEPAGRTLAGQSGYRLRSGTKQAGHSADGEVLRGSQDCKTLHTQNSPGTC